MSTGSKQKSNGIAFVNDNNPIMDTISRQLAISGFNILFHTESIKNAIGKLEAMDVFPETCIVDLDFHDRHILAEIRQFTESFPQIKFIAYSETDNERIVKSLLKLGFKAYLLIGCDENDFGRAIEKVSNDESFFSVGVAAIAKEYYSNN